MSHEPDAKVAVGDRKEESSGKKLKPCCACPETKKARDEWQVKSGVWQWLILTLNAFVGTREVTSQDVKWCYKQHYRQ